MTRRATTPMRVAARPLRQLCALAALAAAAAVVVLPALHGAHALPLAGAAAVASDALPAFEPHAHLDAAACELCAAVGHARNAIAAPEAALPASPAVSTSALSPRDSAPPSLVAAAPFAPRAPPARI